MILTDVTPSAVHVGNIVQGARMAWAQGRELTSSDEETDNAKKVLYQIPCKPTAYSDRNYRICNCNGIYFSNIIT
jgi:hypothetical protein